MIKYFITIMLLLSCIGNNLKAQDNFFYRDGKKVHFELSSTNKVYIEFKKGTSSLMKEQILTNGNAEQIPHKEKLGKSDNIIVNIKSSVKVNDIKSKLLEEDDVSFVSDFYIEKGTGELFSVTNTIKVRLKETTNLDEFYNLIDGYNLKVKRKSKFLKDLFYLVPLNKKEDVVTIANRLYETGLFYFSSPDRLSKLHYYGLPSDTYINDQWSITKTKLNGVWDNYTTGSSSIKIAIIDDGIDYYHEDLDDNVDAFHGYDATDANGDGQNDMGDNHGTECAGVAAAKGNNGKGIAGAAYNCTLIPVRISKGFNQTSKNYDVWASEEAVAYSIEYATYILDADIISLSWGNKSGISDDVKYALQDSYINGRGHLGCVLVAASGNADEPTPDYNVAFPAALPEVIAVGSSDSDDKRSSFSCYTRGVDLIAPGKGIKTTAPYPELYSTVDGTSFSCPFVAGVAALMLSKEQFLSSKDVKRILLETCDKPYYGTTYQYSTIKEYGAWNSQVGYGRVNALAALQDVVGVSNPDPTGNNPILANQLRPSDSFDNDCFGTSLGIYKDWMVVGATTHNKCYIYVMSDGRWQEKQILSPQSPGFFGSSVSVYSDYLVVGAAAQSAGTNYPTEYGAVYIYKLVNNNWSFIQSIVSPTGYGCQGFGKEVSIFNDYLAVTGHQASGGTYVYKKGANGQFSFQCKISDSDQPQMLFGGQVKLSGRFLAIRNNNSGTNQYGATIFRCENNSWVPIKYFVNYNSGGGVVFDLNGDLFVMEGYRHFYLYRKNSEDYWDLVTGDIECVEPNNEYYYRWFKSVSIWGNTIVAGNPFYNDKGRVAVFKTDYEDWFQYNTEVLTTSHSYDDECYGMDLALSEHLLIVGDIGSLSYSRKGSVYTYSQPSNIFEQAINEANLSCSSGTYQFKAGKINLGGDGLTYEVKSNADIAYQGNSIIMKSGFKVLNGAHFNARTFQTGPILKSASVVDNEMASETEKVVFQSVTVDIIPSELLNDKSITVYPNPTTGKVKISSTDKETSFRYILSDITGRILLEKHDLSGSDEMDLSQYSDGVYLLKVKIGENNHLCKIIKK